MPTSQRAKDALTLVSSLQSRFVEGLEKIASQFGDPVTFELTEWHRDAGTHGGGSRYSAPECTFFNRGSVNVSQIHYGDLPDKKLDSATAISTIIHPANPHSPSVHIHISWTEMKDGKGYWRIMADLNPSVVHEEYRDAFTDTMRSAAPDQYEEASAQGDRYFFIPALGRHRGVTHFYLESYFTNDPDADHALADTFGKAVIDSYLDILTRASTDYPDYDEEAKSTQIAYHTLYLFQVLTLDRGTTSGLLVHDQNDLGIMGSLPAEIDHDLLASWNEKVEEPQQDLVRGLADAFTGSGVVPVTDEAKLRLASTVREFYQSKPEALSLQAAGNTIPPTVDNHR